jgi:hypothetical protein
MSTLKVNTLQNTSGVEVYTAKAWVNFNGTGTVAIRASGNVSSITDNGTGDYTVNFTTALPDANYSIAGNSGQTGVGGNQSVVNPNYNGAANTTTTARIVVHNFSVALDSPFVNIAVFR